MADEAALDKKEEMVPKSLYDGLARDFNDFKQNSGKEAANKVKALEDERNDLKKKLAKAEEDLKALYKSHAELQQKQPGFKKPYEYQEGDSKCHPVLPGEQCPSCGWSSDKRNPKHHEPHPIRV